MQFVLHTQKVFVYCNMKTMNWKQIAISKHYDTVIRLPESGVKIDKLFVTFIYFEVWNTYNQN